jgi:hypothetical protein
MIDMSVFKIGTVVVYRTDDQVFGHVVGFTRVWEDSREVYQTKIVVQWAIDFETHYTLPRSVVLF